MRFSPHVLWVGLCLALLLQACTNLAPAPPVVDFDREYDFSQVHAIAIQPIARDTVSTMLITDRQIKRINDALTTELLRRDFKVVAENKDADMYLSWKYIARDSGTLSPFDPAALKYIAGTLHVNMIDPIVLQSKWRATFQADIKVQPESEEGAIFRQEAVRMILADFPPR